MNEVAKVVHEQIEFVDEKDIILPDGKEIVQAERKEIQNTGEAGSLLRMALDKGLGLEGLEKLIELKNKEEERAAKREFDMHFAAMQAELPLIPRTKNSHTNSYAPIEEMVSRVKPILSKYGFSYSFSQEERENNTLRIWCTISGFGYDKRCCVDVHVHAPSKATNGNQEIGSAKSYGRRYALKDILGLVEVGEDDDGNSSGRKGGDTGDRREADPPDQERGKMNSASNEGIAEAAAALRNYPNKSIILPLGKIMNSIKSNPEKLKAFTKLLTDPNQPKTLDFVQIVEKTIKGA